MLFLNAVSLPCVYFVFFDNCAHRAIPKQKQVEEEKRSRIEFHNDVERVHTI